MPTLRITMTHGGRIETSDYVWNENKIVMRSYTIIRYVPLPGRSVGFRPRCKERETMSFGTLCLHDIKRILVVKNG